MVQWRGRRRSSNVEDRRGQRVTRGRRGGPGVKLGGIGTIVVVALIYFSGGDVGQILSVLLGSGGNPSPGLSTTNSAPPSRAPGQDQAAEYVSVILADTEDTWGPIFAGAQQQYPQPKLTLFSREVESACGYNTAAVGPFYCPPDQRVYLDLTFFGQLADLGAPGDFAQAYVIGHEIGHHVQNVTGVLDSVQRLKRQRSQVEANQLQVMVELQADCYAGVWAHHAEQQRNLLEAGDIEEGLRAAAAIGDDTLQKRAGARVQPEAFTHGSAKQRMQWFRRGMDSGDPASCDTFSAAGERLALAKNLAPAQQPSAKTGAALAFLNQRSDVQVRGVGEVIRLLSDDQQGSRHQRFILRLENDQSLLVAHNIDLAPRLNDLAVGDTVEFYGEYEYNARGGVLHWTHHDPGGRHPHGWLKHNNSTYQ